MSLHSQNINVIRSRMREHKIIIKRTEVKDTRLCNNSSQVVSFSLSNVRGQNRDSLFLTLT